MGSPLKLSTVLFIGFLLSFAAILSVHGSHVEQKAPSAVWFKPIDAAVTPPPSPLESTTLKGSACRKVMMIMAKRMMKHMNECSKELKEKYPQKEDFQKHFQCTLRCFMQKVNLVDNEYRLSDETFEAFVNGSIPERYQDMVREKGTPCMRQFSSRLDASDEFCSQHGEYVKCLQNTVAENC